MIGMERQGCLAELFLKPRHKYIESSFSVHQWHVISLLIHGFLPVNARLLIAFGTAFYAIILCYVCKVIIYNNLHIAKSFDGNLLILICDCAFTLD